MSQIASVSAAEFPFEAHFHELQDGHRMHYVDEGEGEVVLMVHGNPTWSFYYRHLIRRLRGGYRTIAVDHVGCGLSDKPGDEAYEYTLSRRIEDLGELMDAVVPRGPVTLVLHDWGGMIGMGWAVRNPDRVKRLVLLNTAAFHLPKSKRFPIALRFVRDTKVGAMLVDRFNAFSRGATRFCVTEKMEPAVVQGFEAPYAAREDRLATLRFVEDIPLSPQDRAYGAVSQTQEKLGLFEDRPIFIGWGHKDFVFDRHFLDRWKEIYPEAEYVEYPQAGHYVLEDRREDLLNRIEAFLQNPPASKEGGEG